MKEKRCISIQLFVYFKRLAKDFLQGEQGSKENKELHFSLASFSLLSY